MKGRDTYRRPRHHCVRADLYLPLVREALHFPEARRYALQYRPAEVVEVEVVPALTSKWRLRNTIVEGT